MLCVVSAGMEKCLSQMVQGWARCPSTISSPPSKIWLWDKAKVMRSMGCQRDIMRMYIWYVYIYMYFNTSIIYIYTCGELGFTDISDISENLDAWNGLKLSETALRSVLIGNRSRNYLDERKQCENSPKQPWYSPDLQTTRKKWKEFWLAKQPIPNFKLCISPGAETHSGRCKKMGVLNLGGRWRAAYVTWPPRI